MEILLKKTSIEDLATLFLYQTDEEANQMAAFTSEDPNDKPAYMKKWTAIINNPEIDNRTIFINDDIVGSVARFEMMGGMNVSYWIGRKYWSKGIANKALKLFIAETKLRPLYGRVAFDNYASQKILEKSNFKLLDKEHGYANARKAEIEEYVYILE